MAILLGRLVEPNLHVECSEAKIHRGGGFDPWRIESPETAGSLTRFLDQDALGQRTCWRSSSSLRLTAWFTTVCTRIFDGALNQCAAGADSVWRGSGAVRAMPQLHKFRRL